MTSVEFYLLENEAADVMRYAANLCLQSYRSKKKVHWYSHDETLLPSLSEQLWQFSQSSFIAHELGQEGLVSLSSGSTAPNSHDDLVVVGEHIPDYFSRFERLQIVVGHDEASKTKARENYRFFRERGHPLQYVPVKHNNF